MPNNPPVKLTVLNAETVTQYNKQKVKCQQSNGVIFDLHLGAKSQKVPVGSQSAEYNFEIWEYTTPKNVKMWCGNLIFEQAGAPQSAPQNAPQAPSQPAGQPNGSDMVRIRSMADSYVKDMLVAGKIIPADYWLEVLDHVAFITTGTIPKRQESQRWPEPSGIDEPENPPPKPKRY